MGKKIRYILAIDSALNGCGVCLYNVQDPKTSITEKKFISRGQAEALVPMVDSVIGSSDIAFGDIDLIATTIGPGTFTGLRVGISAAKSFSLALSLPMLGFSTLEVLAEEYFKKVDNNDANLCVLLDSKREDYFCQIWDNQKSVLYEASAMASDVVVEAVGLEKTVFIGDGLERFQSKVGTLHNAVYQDLFVQPNPQVLAEMAFRKSIDIKVFSDIAPLYLRGADISRPKKPARKLKV